LILGALKPEILIDLIRNFSIFTETEKGKIKILARYHQFRAVNKTINRFLKKETPEDRSGIIWHTQGSGKSLSMVFLIRKIRTIDELKQFKIVIVTDRTDLEGQLEGTAGLAEKPKKIINTNQLMRELRTDTSNLVMVMVQKFLKRDKNRALEDDLPEYIDFPKLNDSEDILILVDEAHRTQGGLFGANVVYALPNATRIGFTGTPLISDKVTKKSYQIFGSYIDKYGMRESENDGSTLPIRYEGKTVQLSVDEIIDEAFEDMFATKTEKEKELIKQKYGTSKSVLEAKKRVNKIAKDIVKHYFENVFDNGFKAQIVASSRLAAVRYKKFIDKALKDYIQNYENSENCDPKRLKRMKFLKSVARITWKNNELPQRVRCAKEAKRDLGPDNINFKSKFDYNNPNSGIAFLIVKDMLLT
ncbi:MAG: DEAD/DEAH box helicase family protein, partial [Candidatus Subteraquimicrobiales bacterium]|nr:DEAD/DEAH box helicase family protein [Candidatus Subteraquimicrobiales bacterium]